MDSFAYKFDLLKHPLKHRKYALLLIANFLFFYFPNCFARSATSLSLFSICSQIKKCQVQNENLIKQLEHQCEIEYKVLECESLAEQNPDLISRLKRCNIEAICSDYEKFELERYGVCLRGYKNALIDTGVALKETAVSAAEFVKEKWTGFKNKNQEDDDNSQQSMLSLSSVHKKMNLIGTAVKEKIQHEYAKYRCFNELAQEEMACYALGNIVDPTMLAVTTFKGAQIVKSVDKALDALDEAKTTTATSEVASLNKTQNLRKAEFRQIDPSVIYGNRVREIPVKNLPKSLSISEYVTQDGSSYQMFEKTVKTPSGEVKKISHELPIDKLTGAYDANFPVGRDFLQTLISEQQGKVSVAFIDVNNLGYINKKFSKGREAGDAYLQMVSKSISDVTEGKAQMFKLGGDEFALVIHETDPIKVQELTQKIIKATHGSEVHKIFKSEKVVRAQMVRNGKESISDFKEFAPYSKEGISVGVTQVGIGETLESVLLRTEKQAQEMKIQTKEALNIDARKYGGAARDPSKRSNLKYEPTAPMPTPAINQREAFSELPSLELAKEPVAMYRKDQLYRFGPISVVNYQNELGQQTTRYERYIRNQTDNTKKMVSREVVVNAKTGLIDGSHEGGQLVLNEFIKTAQSTEKLSSEQNRSLLWINAENLGKINYFHNGTASGDSLLRITGETIRREIGKNDIPFKMQGSEFVIAVQGVSASQLKSLENKIQKSLQDNPDIKKIFADQKEYLKNELKNSSSDPAKKAALQKNLADFKKIKPKFNLRGKEIDKMDSLEKALSIIKQD